MLYLHDGVTRYLTFDGTNYRMPNAPLIVDSLDAGSGDIKTTGSLRGGSLTVSGQTTSNGNLHFATVNSKISFYAPSDFAFIQYLADDDSADNPWANSGSGENSVLLIKVGDNAGDVHSDAIRLDSSTGIVLKALDVRVRGPLSVSGSLGAGATTVASLSAGSGAISTSGSLSGGVAALGNTTVVGDIRTYRTGGQEGYIFLHNGTSRYLNFDGTRYRLPGATLSVDSIDAGSGAFTTTGSVNAGSVVVSGNITASGTLSAGATTLDGDLVFPGASIRKIIFNNSFAEGLDTGVISFISNDNNTTANPFATSTSYESSVLELRVGNDANSTPNEISDSIRIDGASGIYLKALDRVIASCKFEARGGVDALGQAISTTGALRAGSLSVSGQSLLSMTTITGTTTSKSYAAGTDLMLKGDPISITGASVSASGLWGSYTRGVDGGDLLLTAGDGASGGNNGSASSSIYGGDVYLRAGRASANGGTQGSSAIRTYAGAIFLQSGSLEQINNRDANTYVNEMMVQGGKVGIGTMDISTKLETLQVSGGVYVENGGITTTGSLNVAQLSTSGDLAFTSYDAKINFVGNSDFARIQYLRNDDSAANPWANTGSDQTSALVISVGDDATEPHGDSMRLEASQGIAIASKDVRVIGDLRSYRPGGTTGVIFLHDGGSRYLHFDGSRYKMPGSPLEAHSIEAGTASLSGDLTFASAAERKIVFNSSTNPGSDYAHVRFISNESSSTTNPWGVQGGTENAVLELSVGNDTKASPDGVTDSIRIDGASGIYLKALDRVIASCKFEARGGLDALGNDIRTTGTLSAGRTTLGDTVVQNGDLRVYRAGGTTGAVFLHNGATRYVHFDGSSYRMPGAPLVVDGLDATASEIKTTGTLRGGSLFAGATTLSSLEVGSGTITTSGSTALGFTTVRGDLRAYRTGGLEGYIFLHNGTSRYLQFDGSRYRMPGAQLVVASLDAGSGTITTTGNVSAGAATLGGDLVFAAAAERKIVFNNERVASGLDTGVIKFISNDNDTAANPFAVSSSHESSVLELKVGNDAESSPTEFSDSIRIDGASGIYLKALDRVIASCKFEARGGVDALGHEIKTTGTLSAGRTTLGDTVVQNADFRVYRTGGTTGVVYLHNGATRYVHFDGSSYRMPGAPLVVDGLDATASEIKTTGTLSAGRTTLGDTVVQNGDLRVYRTGGTTGAVFLHNGATRYVHFDGSSYRMPGAPLVVDGLDATASEIKTTGNLSADKVTANSFETLSGSRAISAAGVYGIVLPRASTGKLVCTIDQFYDGLWHASADVLIPANDNVRALVTAATKFQYVQNRITGDIRPVGGANSTAINIDAVQAEVNVTRLDQASTLRWTYTVFSRLSS